MKIINMKQIKLKHQLAILITFSIFMLLMVEMFYYYQISTVIRNRVEVYTDSILNQVADKLTYTSQQIKQSADLFAFNKYAQQLSTEDDPEKRFELNKIVSDMLGYIKSSNKSIDNLALVDLKKRTINLTALPSNILDQLEAKYKIYDCNSNASAFSGVVKDMLGGSHYYIYMRPTFLSLPGADPKQKIGTCIVLCKTDYLFDIISKISMTKNSFFLILDSENKVVAGNNSEGMVEKPIGGDVISLFNNSDNKIIKTYNGRKSLIQYKNINDMGWKVISIIPLSEINVDLIPARNYGLIIVFIVSLLLMALGIIFNSNITRPIADIVKFMNRSAHKNLSHRLDIKETNEIGQLMVHINNMLDEIQDMTGRIVSTQSSLYEMELVKKQAELSALQSQINPHFLYNTLDCIQGMGYLYKSTEIVSITSSLSKILRYSIKADDVVYIKDELDCIKDYLNIISIRFCGKYSFSIEVDENLLDMKTIKFILQPIVENSIYHGLERKSGNGFLKVKGFLKANNNIYLEIYDNGKGISSDEMDILSKRLNNDSFQSFLSGYEGRSIGLANINNRIKYVYGKEYGIKIFSKKDEGTTVILEFPKLSCKSV